MVRIGLPIVAMVACVSFLSPASASELSEKVDVGDYAPSYASTKCGGVDDGVAEGKTTCYTCRAGAEPVFYVFVKNQKPSKEVVNLLTQLDTLVGKKQKDKVVGVINFVGDPKNESERNHVKDLGQKLGLKHVALTVTGDGSKFDLNETDDVTIIMYEKGIIRFRSSTPAEQLNKKMTDVLIRRSKLLID